MSTEIVVMSEDEARRLTERIRIAVVNYADAKAKVLTLVQQAQDGQAWAALGFPSWTAYIADVFSDEPLRLARDDRREMVALLSNTGMSERAIAGVVSAGAGTIHRDITAVTGAPNGAPEQSKETTGLDGKTYTRPQRDDYVPPLRFPKRPDYYADYASAVLTLNNAVEKITRIHDDDRFPKNAEKVATTFRSDLLRAIDAMQRIEADLAKATA